MTPEGLNKFCRALAAVMFTVGVMGCFACLPYALSSSMLWVHTAGVYFVAGGIIMSGGLISYILLTQQKTC